MTSQPLLILGNGPSLRGLDLHGVGMATLGMNAAYRYWRTIGFRPTYYACLDPVAGLSHVDAIRHLVDENRIRRFLLRDNVCKRIGDSPRVINFDELLTADQLFAVSEITTGSHSLLFAVFWGYRTIGIAGVDLNHQESVDETRQISDTVMEIKTTPSSNPSYFFDEYLQEGDRFQAPDLTPGIHYESWRKAAKSVADAGARVFNVADKSPLDLFPYVSLEYFRQLASN